jgi:hypothetical protein
MPDATTAARRGPKPKADRGTPTGYRVGVRTRFELGLAQSFLGTRSLQETIDIAVRELLIQLRAEDGFEEALAAAETAQRRRAKVSALLPRNSVE